jgi:molybdopterin converting factor small subunit
VAVRFLLPSYLRPFAGGTARLELDARPSTVGEALALLGSLHPGVRDRVLTERGEVRPHVNVFVGEESIRYSGGLGTPLPDQAEISIVPAVSGGAPVRQTIGLLLALAMLAGVRPVLAVTNADLPHPRLGLYAHALGTGFPLVRSDGTRDEALLDAIARYDAVVLSVSPFTEYRSDVLTALRQRNPSIKLYAYTQADYAYWALQPDSLDHLPTRHWRLVRDLNGFLYDKTGSEFRDANINRAKRVNGRFVVAEALADFFAQAVVGSGRWDGVFFDRFCGSILWNQTPLEQIDVVRAGYPDEASFDAAWHASSDTLANRLRRLIGGVPVLMGNCGTSVQYSAMNGWMHENFPFQNGGTWKTNLFRVPGGYMVDEASFRAPQANWMVSWVTDAAHPYAAEQTRRARLGLGSAAMGDGFGTFNPPDLDVTTDYMSWWYDEYAVDLATGRSSNLRAHVGWLGRALGPYTTIASIGSEDAGASNPGFETDVAGWEFATTAGATLQRDGTTAAVGLASARVRVPAAGTGPSSTRLATLGYLSLWPESPCLITFWARAASPRTIGVAAIEAFNGRDFFATNVAIDATWRRYQVPVTTPATDQIVRLDFRLGGAAVDAWIDDAHMVRTGIDLYRRDFEHGVVLVNPNAVPLPVLLDQPYRRIRGVVDPLTNDGAEGAQTTVAPNDALFLVRASGLVDVDPARDAGVGGALQWSGLAPNPAPAGTAMAARLLVKAPGRATIAVHDAAGRRVRLLFDGLLEAGSRAVMWDGVDEHGGPVSRGLYFLRAAQGPVSVTRKIVRT